MSIWNSAKVTTDVVIQKQRSAYLSGTYENWPRFNNYIAFLAVWCEVSRIKSFPSSHIVVSVSWYFWHVYFCTIHHEYGLCLNPSYMWWVSLLYFGISTKHGVCCVPIHIYIDIYLIGLFQAAVYQIFGQLICWL